MNVFKTIFVLIALISVSAAKYEELCARFVDGMKFREPGNCQAYVTCENGIATVTDCPDGELYDKDSKKCVKSLSDSYCEEICKGKKDMWLSDPANCNGYYYCKSGKGAQGTCSKGYHFDQKGQNCIFPEDSDCTDISDFCGILPSGTSFADPKNCNKYFQCSRGSMKKSSCSSGLYYDVTSAKCKNMFEVPCKAHPIPANICGKNKKPIHDKYVEDKMTCRGYYYCAYKGSKLSDKSPKWNQCASGKFFNLKKQACENPTETKCAHNRCEGRGDSKVIDEVFGCRDYIVCENGLVKEKRKCPKDMFFNEEVQACTLKETFYSVCDF